LREAVRACKVKTSFDIDAWVVLPEYMHCIWTLPPNDDEICGHSSLCSVP
jgi:putative transposase